MAIIDPRNLGARADGTNDDTAALQAALNAANEQNGGRVLLDGGVFRSGTLYLKSNTTLEITKGTVLRALPKAELFPHIPIAHYSRMDTVPWRAFIYAFDAENITICGEGLIDGMGSDPVFDERKIANNPNRPYGLHIVKCRTVTVSGLHLQNSSFWMQRYLDCDHVRIDGLTVFNHCNFNNDGCDIDSCRDVIVSNCLIDSADDSLCFKSEGAAICENVVATNCILSSLASPLKWGTASIGGFRNFSVSNITIRPSKAKENVHGLNADYGLAGIDIACVDGGLVENIQISNIVIDRVETPIFIKLGNRQSRLDESGEREGAHWPNAPAKQPGVIRNVRISNVMATGYGPIACSIAGYEGNLISGLVLTGITLHCGRSANEENQLVWDKNGKEVFHPEPSSESVAFVQPSWDLDIGEHQYPMNRIYNTPLPSYGFYIAYAEDILISDLELRPAKKDLRPAIGFQNARNIRMRAVDATTNGGVEPMQGRSVEGLIMDGSPLTISTPTPSPAK